MTFRATSASCDNQSFPGRRSFQSNSSFNSNFPGGYNNNYTHNLNITLNGPGASHLEQVIYDVKDVNLLTTVMTDQAIIKTTICSVETYESYKNKFETWITSVENAA